MKRTVNLHLNKILHHYNAVMEVMESGARAEDAAEERAYGGSVRAAKGKLQEYITEELIKAAWAEVGGTEKSLRIDSHKYQIPITDDYIQSLDNDDLKNHLNKNKTNHYYGLSIDKQIYINNTLILGAECKAYAEIAMFKRILVDFALLKAFIQPNLECYLVQLESMLGGDFNRCADSVFGSESVHALQSCFHNIRIANRTVDVKINFITLLREDRKVDKPIHKPQFFKEMKREDIEFALDAFVEGMKGFKK